MSSPLFVLDSSSLFHIKSHVPPSDQWRLFETMKDLVLDGRIAVPRQVIAEARNVRHHDGPEIWLLGIAPDLQHPKNASIENQAGVMAAVGSRVVDPDAEGEPADPYVIALALDLMKEGQDTVVVTEDYIDRPPMISLATACHELEVTTWRLERMLDAIGFT